jgi:hypothetical protein
MQAACRKPAASPTSPDQDITTMRGIEIPIVAMAIGAAIAIVSMVVGAIRKSMAEKSRHDTYARMVASGQVDRQMLEDILRAIEKRPAPGPDRGGAGMFLQRLVFLIGWLGIFTGIGLLIVGGVSGDDDVCLGGGIVLVGGVGLASAPIAWREVKTKLLGESRSFES